MKVLKQLRNGVEKLVGNISLSLGILLVCIIFITACKKSNPTPGSNGSPDLKLIAGDLAAPLTLAEAPDDTKRLFIVDQVGKIWIVYPDSTKPSTVFIDISSKMVTLQTGYDERGLLGLAFHPGYKTNGKFYLFYTAPPRAGGPGPVYLG
jgi:hypothetical protein